MTSSSSPWFRGESRRLGARLRLFCLPYAGGGAIVFRQWADGLPVEIEPWPIQLPGRETRLRERPFNRMGPLADALLDAIPPLLDRPFALFGHSMGAYIAYELARRLEERDVHPTHLFVSGRQAPHLPLPGPPASGLPTPEFLRVVQHRYRGIPEAVWREPELLDLLLPTLCADLELTETYQPARTTVLACPLTVFGGLQDPHIHPESLATWQALAGPSFRLHLLEGDHFYLNQSRPRLLAIIAQELGSPAPG